MPEQTDDYIGCGQKLTSLSARRLFTQRRHSLIELARILRCLTKLYCAWWKISAGHKELKSRNTWKEKENGIV